MSALRQLPEGSAAWLSDCLTFMLMEDEPTRELITTLDTPSDIAKQATAVLAAGEELGLLTHTVEPDGYLDEHGQATLIDDAQWWSLTELGRRVAEAFDSQDAVADDVDHLKLVIETHRDPSEPLSGS